MISNSILFSQTGLFAQHQKKEINLLVHKIDSLRFSNPDKHKEWIIDGGVTSAYFDKDNLVYLHFLQVDELINRMIVTYFKDDQPIKIHLYEQIPDWEEFNENPKHDSLEALQDILNVMMYKESSTNIYISDSIRAYNLERGKEILVPEVNTGQFKRVLSAISNMRAKISGVEPSLVTDTLTSRDSLENYVGKLITIKGKIHYAFIPTLMGVDISCYDVYRNSGDPDGKIGIATGILVKTVMTGTDGSTQNRGDGTFYHLKDPDLRKASYAEVKLVEE